MLASLVVKDAMGWTPLTIADGVLYTFTIKSNPHTAVLLRQLMAKQGLNVPPPHPAPDARPAAQP